MLEVLVDKVVRAVLRGADPNETIVKLVRSTPNLTDEHVKRVIEMTNVRLFNEMFKRGRHEFNLADPKVILEKLHGKGEIKKKAYEFSDQDFDATGLIQESFEPVYDPVFASGDDLPATSRFWKQSTIEKNAEYEEVLSFERLKRLREILEGVNYKIPTISKIASYISDQDRINLEFKKASGFEESEELATEFLKIVRGEAV